jgi:glycerol-3-phosphate acyltransferase PlsX
MGSIFCRYRFGVDAPKVGLLSIGEEPGKGDTLRKETYPLLVEAAAAAELNFIGNVEGRDVMSDTADVIVADGFTGNVVLKTLEGGLKSIVSALLEAFASEPHYREPADALMPALMPLYEMLDPETYGGAMLLGVDGVCIISHGSSSERAIVNAIDVAREMVEADVVGAISMAIRP